MQDAQDRIVIAQIKDLLDLLETNSKLPHNQDLSPNNNNLLSKLLEISCDRYWIYEPTTHVMEIFYRDAQSKQIKKVIHSLSTLQDNLDDMNRKKITEAFERLLNRTSDEERFEYSSCIDGQTNVYDVSACVWLNGTDFKIIGSTHIITRIQQSVEDMQEAQKKYESLLGLSSMYIWEYDVKRKHFSANHSLCVKLGLQEKPYTFEELEETVHILELSKFIEWIENKEIQDKAIVHMQTKSNTFESTFETNFKAISDSHDDYSLIIGIMIDVTEHELLRTMASKDSLTGCYNRNMADVTLESSFKKFRENGEFYTIIFFDVDRFKTVNDRYGHDMGDFVLKSVCEYIGKEIRSNDMIFRWGGDEFLLICRGIAKENIYGYIDRLRKIIEASIFEFKGTKLQVTISIGSAIYYKTDEDHSFAMKRADRSLYKAKLAGRNKVCMLK